MMRGIPNFKERGCGSVVLQSDMRDSIEEQPPPSSYAQALQIMVSAARLLWKKYEHNRDGYTNAKTEMVKQYTEKARILYGNRY